ncbi:MAG: endonuclease VIII [Acidobacteriota bacterium]
MPEGPEIHREADRVGKAVGGQVAREVFFAFDALQPAAAELSGRRVEGVEARGKAILTRFEGERVVYSHNQLYGKWFVKKAGETPKTNRQLRFAVHTDARSALLYSASEIEVLDAAELADQSYLAKLGPDPLADESLAADSVAARLHSDAFRRRSLGHLLLDQGFLGGIGNYLRSEILWRAAVHPGRKAQDLEDDEAERVAAAALDIPRRSYRTGGVTSDPERVEALKAEGATRRRWRFNVFSQDGRPCPRCGDTVVRREVAGRRLYLCPSCQPEP